MTQETTPGLTAEDDLVDRAERDRHRPRFHFVSPAGWLNDPNGAAKRGSIYHLFYQYNPHAAVHHRIHWGHATSRDLVTWADEPVALVPGEAGPDRDGCWSGVLVDDGGTPTLVYSGHRDGELEVACLATGSADLRKWTKDPGNPVITAPEGLDLVGMRDHCIWREGGRWRHLMGAGICGVGGTTLMFESDDLRRWDYLGPLVVGDSSGRSLGGRPGEPDWQAEMWECIDLFRLGPDGTSSSPGMPAVPGGTDVLVFSAWADDVTLHTLHLTGTYDGRRFAPSALHRFDYGERAYYAPQSFLDDDGRRVVHGWIQEERPRAASVAAGWSGAMALPRLIRLDGAGTPEFSPVSEALQLRREHVPVVSDVALGPGDVLDGPNGDQLDIEADVVLAPGSRVQLIVRRSADDAERTTIEVARSASPGEGRLRLERSAGSLDPDVDASPRSGKTPIGDDGRVRLRVLVDHSVLEVFANGRALTSRVYPTRPDADGTRLAVPERDREDAGATAEPVLVERFEAWRMADIWSGARRLWP